MNTSATTPHGRPLGPLETYFWLSDHANSKHFVTAAEVIGATTLYQWRYALNALQQRHPLLRVTVRPDNDGIPHFHPIDTPIQLRPVLGIDPAQWEREMEQELSIPFNIGEGPLMRAVLLHCPEKATVLISIHHSVADGLSVTFLIRDLLSAISGNRLPALDLPPAQENLLSPTADFAPPLPPSNGGSAVTRLSRTGRSPHVSKLRLSSTTTGRLRERTRIEGTTVHGALVTALVMSGRRRNGVWSEQPVRVVSPMDVRALLGREDDCVLTIAGGTGRFDFDYDNPIDFWKCARIVSKQVAALRTRNGVGALFAAMRELTDARLGVAGTADAELQIFASEMMVSNLGVIKYGPDFGALHLSALWGPSLFIGIAGEQVVGVATINGSIHLLHSSFDPIQNHLVEASAILESVIGASPGKL